jgi:hypothetical protein
MKNLKKIQAFLFAIVLYLVLSTGPVMAAEAGSSAKLKETNQLYLKQSKETRRKAALLANYLSYYNSPLAQHAQDFVETADKYELDWKLLPAISGVESTFAKKYIKGTHNAWGWGGGRIEFTTWNEAIDEIASKMKSNYIDKWDADSIEEIGRIYAPPSPSWARNVRFFMRDIDRFGKVKPALALNLSL